MNNISIRKHTIPAISRKEPQQNIKIIVNPQNKTISNIQNIKNNSITIKQPQAPLPAPAPTSRIVINKSFVKQQAKTIPKEPQITYKYQDAPPESIPRINALRYTGKGKILLVIANGPSINEVDYSDIKSYKEIEILSINRPDPRIWPTTYWSFYDTSQMRRHEDIFTNYEGTLFNSTSIKRYKPKSVIFKNIGGKKFSRDLTQGLCIGRTSCYAAMQIALWMDYDRIYLFGVDMDPNGLNGQLHFYGENPDVKPDLRKSRFASEAEYFEFAAENMHLTERMKFYFCSSYLNWPFVDKFKRLDHKEAIKHIKEYIDYRQRVL